MASSRGSRVLTETKRQAHRKIRRLAHLPAVLSLLCGELPLTVLMVEVGVHLSHDYGVLIHLLRNSPAMLKPRGHFNPVIQRGVGGHPPHGRRKSFAPIASSVV